MKFFPHLALIPLITLLAIPLHSLAGEHNSGSDSLGSYIPVPEPERELYKKFKIFVGPSFPLREFADNDIGSVNSGYAPLGVAIGMEYSSEIIHGFGWSISGMGSFHASDFSEWQKAIPFYNYHGDGRTILTLMGGVLLDIDVFSFLNLYTVAQTGLLSAGHPDFSVVGEKVSITAPNKITIGYNLGVGARSGNYDIAGRFLYGAPEYQEKFILYEQTYEFLPVIKPVKAIQLMVGINFN